MCYATHDRGGRRLERGRRGLHVRPARSSLRRATPEIHDSGRVAGSFQYRSPLGRGLMTPGSLMLGNQGQSYECGHEHGEGDRCVSFWYARDYSNDWQPMPELVEEM